MYVYSYVLRSNIHCLHGHTMMTQLHRANLSWHIVHRLYSTHSTYILHIHVFLVSGCILYIHVPILLCYCACTTKSVTCLFETLFVYVYLQRLDSPAYSHYAPTTKSNPHQNHTITHNTVWENSAQLQSWQILTDAIIVVCISSSKTYSLWWPQMNALLTILKKNT